MSFPQSRFRNPFGFSLTLWVKRLLILNVVVWLAGLVLGWFGLGGILREWLALYPAAVLYRPWTVLTYMFVHGGLGHLFFNMLGLFFFGPPLEERWGPTEFLKFYLACGLGGALFSFLLPTTPIIGASAAIFGVLLAYAMAWPDNQIYIWGILPVKAKWLVTFYILLTVLGTFGYGGSGVAYLAHLGGLVVGFAYLKSPWAPSPWGPPAVGKQRSHRSGARWPELRWRKPAARSPQSAHVARPAGTPLRRSARDGDAALRADERELLEDVDRILDKISQSGMASLTERERRQLDEVSRRYRSN